MKILILIFFLPSFIFSQDLTQKINQLDSFMTLSAEVKGFNGNVLVAKDGKVLYEKSFGYKNYDTKEPLDLNTVFEIASASKQFTAAGILLLAEKEKLNLSDSLRKFFPELPYSGITIKDLLIHTSGLPDYMLPMITGWDRSKVAFNDDVIKFMSEQNIPAVFKPGERFQYSNFGYALMASIIEKVSGQSFADYMRQNIFEPLGMERSLIFNTRRSLHNFPVNYALGYEWSDSLGKYVLPDSTYQFGYVKFLDGIVGDGIVNSTVGDLFKWDRAMKNHTLLSEHMQSEMNTPHSLYDTTKKISYGYGVLLDSGELGKRIYHGGAWPGYSTVTMRTEPEDISVIILSNNSTYALTIATTLTNIVHGGMFEYPDRHVIAGVNTNGFKYYEGTYALPNGETLQLINDGGKLLYPVPENVRYFYGGKESVDLLPEAENKFFFDDGIDMQVEFMRDAEGRVITAYLIDTGYKIEIKKIK